MSKFEGELRHLFICNFKNVQTESFDLCDTQQKF